MAETSAFRVPPEVPRHFADKSLRPAFSWLDVWAEEHAYAFTVAKATDVERLSTIGVVPLALGGASTLGTALPRLATDAVRRAWYGRGSSRLAEMFMAPDSVERMRAIAARGAGSPFLDATMRQGLQGPNAVQR